MAEQAIIAAFTAEEGRKRRLEDDEYAPFGNTVEELSRWHGFSDEYIERQKQLREKAALERNERALAGGERDRQDATWPDGGGPREQVVSAKVGRNAPCPCGSSK